MSNGTITHLRELMSRGQRLVDAPRPAAGQPPQWHLQAWLIGDLPALAAGLVQVRERPQPR